MTQLREGELLIRLPYEFEHPDYDIGGAVLANAAGSFQGIIMGAKYSADTGWQYLICSDQLECWATEAAIIPFEGGCHYRERWYISSEGWGKDFVFTIYDKETQLDTKGMSLHQSHVEALIAARRFLDREFPLSGIASLREVA